MRGLVVSGVGVLLAVMLAGCSSGSGADGQPATKLPPTHSSDPTTTAPSTAVLPTPRPTPKSTPSKPAKPTLPAVAKQDTAAGAEAAAEYWFHAWDYAFQVGNTQFMRAVSTSSCGACENFKAGIDQSVREGWQYTSKPSRLRQASTVDFSRHSSTVKISFIAAKVERYDPSTKKKTVGKQFGATVIDVKISWLHGRWLTSQVSVEVQ